MKYHAEIPPHDCGATSGPTALVACGKHGRCEAVRLDWACGVREWLQHGSPIPAPRKPRATTQAVEGVIPSDGRGRPLPGRQLGRERRPRPSD